MNKTSSESQTKAIPLLLHVIQQLSKRLESVADTNERLEIATNACEIVRLLISHGADVNTEVTMKVSEDRVLPKRGNLLHYAINEDSPLDITHCLIDNGADVDAIDNFADTPLHSVVKSFDSAQRVETARILLSNDANVNASDSCQMTPLHLLVYQCNLWRDDEENDENFILLRLLLENGANVNTVSNRGEWSDSKQFSTLKQGKMLRVFRDFLRAAFVSFLLVGKCLERSFILTIRRGERQDTFIKT